MTALQYNMTPCQSCKPKVCKHGLRIVFCTWNAISGQQNHNVKQLRSINAQYMKRAWKEAAHLECQRGPAGSQCQIERSEGLLSSARLPLPSCLHQSASCTLGLCCTFSLCLSSQPHPAQGPMHSFLTYSLIQRRNHDCHSSEQTATVQMPLSIASLVGRPSISNLLGKFCCPGHTPVCNLLSA